ncbi:MAG: hypothetical protein KDA79_17635 [Planctomycetaceae bacterium]|nr:hypothetical protein [Planctomycetaceae bacterium]
MEAAEGWRALFENWPEAVERKGLLVTRYQETIPFVGFLISAGLVLLERDKPDTVGARKVMLSYDQIAAVKLTSPMELARFQVMGFQAPY